VTAPEHSAASKAVEVKICGVMTAEAARVAAEAGAAYLGLVFFPPSPRSLDPNAAAALLADCPRGPRRVALTVDPDDATLARLADLPLDIVQLHGHESPARVVEIRSATGFEVMKAIGIAEATDLDAIDAYAEVADRLLLDAKPPPGATRPGGNALRFDWRILANRRVPRPWLLAGGLTPENAAEAVRLTGAPGLDVSSGVESAPGVKDPAKIRAFIAAANAASTGAASAR